MRRSSRVLLVPFLLGALALPAAPPATAAPLEPLVVKTVRIGEKPVRFVLAVDADEHGFVLMKFRRDGRWRTVASDRTDCNYYDGSHDPSLVVQKADRQVLVSWSGPGDDVTSEYGGYRIRRKTIEMFGAEGCTAAG